MATRGQGLKTNKSKQKKTGEMSQSILRVAKWNLKKLDQRWMTYQMI